MKRIVSFLLSLLMVISMIPRAAFATEEVTEPEVISAEEVTVPETDPTGEVTEPEAVSTEEVTEPEALPTEEATEPETLPTEEATQPETAPSEDTTEPETEEDTQAPAPRSGDAMSQEDFLAALDAAGAGYKLTQNVTVTEDADINIAFTIAQGGSLTVAGDVTLTLYTPVTLAGSITVCSGAALVTAEGAHLYICQSGLLLLQEGASVTADGNIEVEAQGQLRIEAGATLVSNGLLTVADGGILTNDGTLEGGFLAGGNSYLDSTALGKYLQEAEGAYTLTIPAVINTDADLGGATLVIGEGGSLTVRSGSSLTLSCELQIAEGGVLTVEEGASLVTAALLKVDGGQLQLDAGSSLTTKSGGAVCVVSGTLYNSGASLSLEGITPYIEQYPRGKVTNIEKSNICYITDISSIRDVSSALNSHQNYGSLRFYARSALELSGQFSLPANVVLYLRATDTATGSLVVAANAALTLEGMIVLEGAGAKLNVEKTGCLVNCGEIFIQADAVLRIREGATLDNQGQVTVNEGGTLYGNGTLTGNAINGTVSKEDTTGLDNLKEGLSQGSYTITERVVLTESMTFHHAVTIGEGGSLVIPKGVTLYLNDDGEIIVNGGHFKVESGGKVQGGNYDTCSLTVNSGSFTILSGGEMILNNTWAGYVYLNGGDVTVYGGTTFEASYIYMTLPTTARVNGIDPKSILASGTFSTMEELRTLLTLGSAYQSLNVSLSYGIEAFALESVTIPEYAVVSFGSLYDGLTIPDGAVVENEGYLAVNYWPLQVEQGGKLLNRRLLDIGNTSLYINNGGSLVNTGTIRSEGSKVVIRQGGLLDNRSNLYLRGETSEILGTVTGNEAQYQTFDDIRTSFACVVYTYEELQTALLEARYAAADYDIYLRFPLESQEGLDIPYNATLYSMEFGSSAPEGAVMVTDSEQLIRELQNSVGSENYLIYIRGDLALDQSITIPESAHLIVSGPEAHLRLKKGASVTANGTVTVSSAAHMTIEKGAVLTAANWFRLLGCAAVTVEKGGKLVLNCTVDTDNGTYLYLYGTLESNGSTIWDGKLFDFSQVKPMSLAELQLLLEESGDTITLDRPLEMGWYDFPDHLTVNLEDGGVLTVSGTWEFGGKLNVLDGGLLEIEYFGTLKNTGTVTLYSGSTVVVDGYGSVQNQGQLLVYSGCQLIKNGDGTFDGTFMGPDSDGGILGKGEIRQEDILEGNGWYNQEFGEYVDVCNFNELYAVAREAAGYGDNVYITVENTMTVTQSLELPENVHLSVRNCVRLDIAEGVSLTGGRGIRVDNAEIRVKSGGSLAGEIVLENNGLVYVEEGGSLACTGTLRLKENALLVNRGTMENSSGITMEAGSKGLTNYGSLTVGDTLYLQSGALLENRGTLTNQDVIRLEEGGQLKNAGELTNNGSLIGEAGSVFSNSGTIRNEGLLKFWEGATATNTGKLTGAGDIEDQSGTLLNKDYAEFLNGVKSGWAEVRKTITVTEDLYIGDAVIFIEEGGNLVIPDGVTVTYDLLSEDTDNRIRIYEGGKLTVEEGGTLVNNYNIMAMNGSTVEVRGSYSFGENGTLWVQEGTDVQGLTRDQLGMQRQVNHAGQLYAALAQEGYRKRLLDISGNIDLTTSLTIGPEDLVRMETYYQYVNITDGAVLTVEGDVDLRAGGFKVRDGGTLVLNGRVENDENGEILVYPGGELIIGGRLEGKESVYVAEEGLPQGETITQAELKELIAEQSPYLDLRNKSVTVTSNLNLASLDYVDITGDAGICPVITVASGVTLTLGDTPLMLNGSKLIIEPGAAVKVTDSGIYIAQDSTLQILDGGTLSAKGCYLTVDSFGSLLVEKESDLILGEENCVSVAPLARVTGVAKRNRALRDAAVSSTGELKTILENFRDYHYLNLYVNIPFTLTEDVTLPENAYLQLDTWYECIPQMTVAPGVTFTAEGEIEVQGVGAELNIEGTLIKREDRTSVWENGALNILSGGTMINEATLQITDKGIVTVCEGGTLDNRDYIDTYGDGQLIVNGTFTGNQPGYTPEIIQRLAADQEELAAILEEAAASNDVFEIYVNRDLQLTQSLVIPDNTTLTLVDGTTTLSRGAELVCEGVLSVYTAELAVEADSRLTVDQTLLVSEGGSLWVKAGANLENNGQILCDDLSWLLMDGTFINLGTVEGQFIPSDQRAVQVYSWKELQEALESGAPGIDVMADVSISRNVAVCNTLRIPEGVTVTVKSGVTLDVQGTVAVYGTLKIIGQTMGRRIESYGGTVTGPEGSWRTEGQLAQEIRFTCNTAMGLGMQQYVNAWVYPADAWDIGLSYEILEGGEFATLEDGLLTATGVGDVTIRATSADGNAFADITVRILDYSVVIDEARSVSRLTEGSKGQIYADLVPGNLTDTEILFSLAEGDEEYAKLSAKNGVATLTAKSLEDGHTVTVLAQSKDGQALAAEWKVTLVPKAESVVILDAAGEPIASGATVTYDLRNQDNLDTDCLIFDAATLPDASLGEVTWSCSDTKGKLVSTVELSVPNRIRLEGFTGKTGTLTLTATAADGSGKKATVKIKLVALPQNIALAESVKDWVLSGKTMTLKAVDVDTGKELSSSLRWRLAREQDEAYVTLKTNGKLTARKVARQQTVEVVGYVPGNEEVAWVSHLITLYPAATKVSIQYETDGWTEDITGTTRFLEAAEESIDLDAWVYPDGDLGAMQAVTWKTSNRSVATVDEDGIVTGTGKTGNVTITATAADGSGKKATVKLKYGIMTRDIDLFLGREPLEEGAVLTLRSGQSLSITGKTVPEKPTTKGITFFLEEPADGDCLQVSASGKLTARTVFMPRTANVVVCSKDGGASEVITVQILPKEERQLLLLDQQETNLTRATKVVQKLDTFTLTAKLLDTSDPENISLEDAQVTWRASNARIAQLSGTEGSEVTVELLRSGSASVTAIADDGTRTSVTVKAVDRLADSIVITDKEGSETLVVASGKSLNLAARVLDREGSLASNKNVTWQVLWGEAKISSSGKLTATSGLAECSVALVEATARDGSGVTQRATVVIVPLTQSISLFREDAEVTNLTLTLAPGDTLELRAEAFPIPEIPEGELLRTVTWKSSAKKVAEIDPVTGQLTALTPGTTNITATATDGSGKKAMVKIRVE